MQLSWQTTKGSRKVSAESKARGFMQRAVQSLTPYIEKEFGPLPPFSLVSRPPDSPPGHPLRGRPVGRGLMAGYDIPTRRPGLYYDPVPLLAAISEGHFFYLDMITHELMHMYQIVAEIKSKRFTHDMLVAEKRKPYKPPVLNYWAEGGANLAEFQVVIRLIDSGAWRKVAKTMFGSTDEDIAWGDYGIVQRIDAKLSSTIILASREHGRARPDASLVPLPFKLPPWLGHLRTLPPYNKPFWQKEVPYYMGAYHCCKWMERCGKNLRQLLRTPVTNSEIRTY